MRSLPVLRLRFFGSRFGRKKIAYTIIFCAAE
jgi:hypothetical protein